MPNLAVLVPATKHITANIRVSKQLGNLNYRQTVLVGVANRNGIQLPLHHRTPKPCLKTPYRALNERMVARKCQSSSNPSDAFFQFIWLNRLVAWLENHATTSLKSCGAINVHATTSLFPKLLAWKELWCRHYPRRINAFFRKAQRFCLCSYTCLCDVSKYLRMADFLITHDVLPIASYIYFHQKSSTLVCVLWHSYALLICLNNLYKRSFYSPKFTLFSVINVYSLFPLLYSTCVVICLLIKRYR